MSSRVKVSSGLIGAFDESQPVAPPSVLISFWPQASPVRPKPVPASSAGPPGQAERPPAVGLEQPRLILGVQRSKKPLFTLTGFFFASNEMLSPLPPL